MLPLFDVAADDVAADDVMAAVVKNIVSNASVVVVADADVSVAVAATVATWKTVSQSSC